MVIIDYKVQFIEMGKNLMYIDSNSSFQNNVLTILHVGRKSDMSAVIIHISFLKKQNTYFRRNIWGYMSKRRKVNIIHLFV